ncbi:MAG: pyrrolysine--tRNA(Pyl) ligase large subunit [Desulfobacterales bacterium]|jgi:phenylalanyl-tRNA synthetase alpha chain
MNIPWTEIQHKRLIELAADGSDLKRRFDGAAVRDKAFQQIEKQLVNIQRMKLNEFREVYRRPKLCRLESRLTDILIQNDFVQVATPTILSKGLLAKMGIDENHPLTPHIFWLGDNRCLRPMLAPHLYFVLKDLLRLWEKPIRIFEIGMCFRKESQGAQHSNEFTMLNLVEMGLGEEGRLDRLKQLAALVAETSGVNDYFFQPESSAVYGETTDILAGGDRVEIGSAAMGPHLLDRAWQITDAWVGIGFGLERLLMVAENSKSLKKMGKSLAYLDGIRLNI